MGFGRALRVGLVGLAAALIALILADARLGAEPARGEGRIAFTFGESGDLHPSQLAVMDADGKNRRVLPPWPVIGRPTAGSSPMDRWGTTASSR